MRAAFIPQSSYSCKDVYCKSSDIWEVNILLETIYLWCPHERVGEGILKFFTCLQILLFLNSRSFFFFMDEWSHFFVDVINVWPLSVK